MENTKPIPRLKKIILSILIVLIYFSSPAAIRYVTQFGSGSLNGTSWANAFRGDSLRFVINTSSPGDEVWVACGTYATTAGTNRTISFSMRNGVAIYGSFQGTETTLSQRILSCGPCSILTGEIGVAGIFDNSYHVISNGNLDNSAIIDGFVIRDANDNRPATSTEGLGGGIYNQGINGGNNCSPTIRNCLITNNRAVYGAGIFNSGAYSGNSNPVISHCIITNNTATDAGGGIDNFGLGGNASPTITNCIIYGNTALVAGGMYCWGGNPGGNSNPVILNCVFANNSATAGNAGGIICDNSNAAGGFNDGTSNLVVRNSIFRNNTASGAGPQFAIKGTGTFNATYSAIDMTAQSFPHIISGAGTGNIFTDPLFENIADANGADNCWMTNDDGLILQNGSAAMDAGNNIGVPALDIRFLSRIQNSTVDIGAYESIAVVLPVHFIFFHGNIRNGNALLNWKTGDAEAGQQFEIQRSIDGSRFEIIGRKFPVGLQSENQFTDFQIAPGKNYYRIRYVNNSSGSTIISNVIVLDNGVRTSKPQFNIDRQNKKISVNSSSPVQLIQLFGANGSLIASSEKSTEINYNTQQNAACLLKVITLWGTSTFKLIL